MTRQVRVKPFLRKVKGRKTKVRVRGHLMKSPKTKWGNKDEKARPYFVWGQKT